MKKKTLLLLTFIVILTVITTGCAKRNDNINSGISTDILEDPSDPSLGSEMSSEPLSSSQASYGSNSGTSTSRQSNSSDSKNSSAFQSSSSSNDTITEAPKRESGYGKFSGIKINDKFGKWPAKKAKPYYASSVSAWFTPYWFSKEDKYFHHWSDFCGTLKPAEFGYYSSGDPDYLKTTLTYLKNIGLDFILIDDTNLHSIYDELIAKNEDSIFNVAAGLGKQSVQVAVATGGLDLANKKFNKVQEGLDIYYKEYFTAYPDTYFKVENKPFTVFFYDPSTDFTDNRYTVRYAAGLCSEQYAAYVRKNRASLGLWGWCYDISLPKAEVMGVQPGYNRRFDQNNTHIVNRENGSHYIDLWLKAVKGNPRYISIASWNDHGEDTSVEAASWWEGEDAFLYQKITEGYLALKYGCIDGFLYKTEGDTRVYQYVRDGNRLVLQSTVPPANQVPVIIVPQNYFSWAGLAVR